jgi:hypothetical protein
MYKIEGDKENNGISLTNKIEDKYSFCKAFLFKKRFVEIRVILWL